MPKHAWREHVMDVMNQTGLPLKQAMRTARSSYSASQCGGGGQQYENSRFIISHGMTPTSTPNEMPSFMPKFILPDGVRVVLFEVAGGRFEHIDAGFIYNWILNTIGNNNAANIDELDETVIRIGLPSLTCAQQWRPACQRMDATLNARDYYCRVYDRPGMVVPNILYTAQDDIVQTGIFKFTKYNNTVPSYCSFRRTVYVSGQWHAAPVGKSNPPKVGEVPHAWRPQFDIEASDTEFNQALFGEAEEVTNMFGNKMWQFKKPHQDLSTVAKIAGNLPERQTIYVISCRSYTSPKIEQAQDRLDTYYDHLNNSQQALNTFMTNVSSVIDWGKLPNNIVNQLEKQREELYRMFNNASQSSLAIIDNLKDGYNNLIDHTTNALTYDSLRNKRIYNISYELTKAAKSYKAKLKIILDVLIPWGSSSGSAGLLFTKEDAEMRKVLFGE